MINSFQIHFATDFEINLAEPFQFNNFQKEITINKTYSKMRDQIYTNYEFPEAREKRSFKAQTCFIFRPGFTFLA